MNHLKARQLKNGKWHYTAQNDNRIWPIGDCGRHDGHETKEEARECYKQYLLNNRLNLDARLSDQLAPCAICKTFTDGMAVVGGRWFKVLCYAHLTREHVEKLLTVDESWES